MDLEEREREREREKNKMDWQTIWSIIYRVMEQQAGIQKYKINEKNN